MEALKTNFFVFCMSMTLALAVITIMLYKQDNSDVVLMSKRITNETEPRNKTKSEKEERNTTESSSRPVLWGNKLYFEFPRMYHATGVITLPYDGISEPFEAWYAEKYNMSRIDYYYGKSCAILLRIIKRTAKNSVVAHSSFEKLST